MWIVRFNAAVLRGGLRIGTQHLLTVRGRKSGEPRSTPVSLATVNGERYIVAAFANAAWVSNVRAAGQATLSRGHTSERVRLNEIPASEREPILRGFLQQVRGGARFFGGRNADDVVAAADDYPVFRVAGVDDDR
jgi:deazaflavin-dependent oxidoreductase (nitroreductase family)